MRKLAVIGAGSWGTVAATLAARTTPTTLWARRPELAESMTRHGENLEYLPGIALPPALQATSDLDDAVAEADLLVMAVPSHGFRRVLSDIVAVSPPGKPVLSLTKGIEQGTLATMTQVVVELCPELDADLVGVLTGPNLA
jgi:glycerol-3-phosphate dehydrogenase (NAD(P)+)